MREIIFRGKNIRNEWVYGNLIKIDKGYLINHSLDFATKVIPNAKYAFALFKDEISAVSEKTIGQYTGLKDKNGKMIFEGDLLFIPLGDFNIEGKHIVHYFEDSFVTSSILFSDLKTANKNALKWVLNRGAYSIGTIHDNPELLPK